MRRLERTLHQHIFKVGWLLTKNLQTTTILYYLIFLPGVFVHEVILWLVAGIFDVRAERAIAWPESQAVAELRLTFIKLARGTSTFKLAIINISPLLFGIIVIGFIANNVLNINGFLLVMGDGNLENLSGALRVLTSTPDFWLWVYLVFAVGNTMWPDHSALRPWRPLVIGLVVAAILLYVIGLGDALVGRTVAGPVLHAVNIFSGTLAVLIVIDLFFTAILGGVESVIERVTRNSATFQNGKLVAMRREEVLKMRQQQREREARQAQPHRTVRPAGPPSIYAFPLPIPGAPGKESEPIVVTKEAQPSLPSVETGRAGPAMITGTAVARPEPRPQLGFPKTPSADEDEDSVEKPSQEEAEDPF